MVFVACGLVRVGQKVAQENEDRDRPYGSQFTRGSKYLFSETAKRIHWAYEPSASVSTIRDREVLRFLPLP
jgi:hypothetical protein